MICERIPITITHDPMINMQTELRDYVTRWVTDGFESGLEMAEGGFRLDGVDYRVAYGPGDGGAVKVIVLLERGGSIEPPKPSRPLRYEI
jgi:hypothetical protein